MSPALPRKVWSPPTPPQSQPAAARTAWTFSSACRVWAPTSPPATCPPAPTPTWPATTTSSPAGAAIPREYIPSGAPKLFGLITLGIVASSVEGSGTASGQADVLEVGRLAVDPAGRRRDPVGELPARRHRLHQALAVARARLGGQPLVLPGIPLGLAQHATVGRDADLGERTDGPAEPSVRQPELEIDAVLPDDLVPARHAAGTVVDVVVAQTLVQRRERRLLAGAEPVALERRDPVRRVLQLMIVVLLRLLEAALQAHRVEVRGVRRDLRAEEVERHRVVEVEVPLQRGQVDPPVLAHLVGLVLAREFTRTLDDAPDTRLADEHVVGLFGEHEAARTRERIEAALGEARELVLAVPVGEVREHEEAEPVGRLLVEGPQDAGLVPVARAPLQQGLRLLASVAAEVRVEQVDHRPEMPSLLDIHLEEVAEVVERRTRAAERTLLLDRRGLGVALRDDQAAEHTAVLARHLLPRGTPLVIAEVDQPPWLRLGDVDAPALRGELHESELRPPLRIHARRGAQVGLLRLEADGPHLRPPVAEPWLPFLEGALQPPFLREVDVVRDPSQVIDTRHQILLRSNSLRCPVPYTTSAPLRPPPPGGRGNPVSPTRARPPNLFF